MLNCAYWKVRTVAATTAQARMIAMRRAVLMLLSRAVRTARHRPPFGGGSPVLFGLFSVSN